MQQSGLLELIVSFFLGVFSSIIATIIIFFFKADSLIDRAIRLRNTRRNLTLNSDNSHTLVRTQWAYALRDLGSKNQDHVLKALKSLSYMADLLDTEEKEVAYEVLKIRCANNKFRKADDLYLNAIRRIRP